MKRKIILVLSYIMLISATGCSKKHEITPIEDGVYDISKEVEAMSKEVKYTDEEIILQDMGDWRTSNGAFEKAKKIGIIPEDVQPNQTVTPTDLINALNKMNKFKLNIDSSNLQLPDVLRVKDFIPIMAQIINSYEPVGNEDVFDINLFRSTFSMKNNNMDTYDDKLIEQMSLLRFFDALLINQDDVMIVDNTLTYNIMANGLIRLGDLRVEQLIKDNFPEECQECGTHVDEWYPKLNEIETKQEIILLPTYTIKYINGSIFINDNISGEDFSPEGIDHSEDDTIQ